MNRRRIAPWLVAILLALPGMIGVAQAAVFTFTTGAYPPCSSGTWSLGGSTWTCNGSMNLAAGDSISPAGTITVVAKAGITLGGSNAIGSASVPVNLTTSGDIHLTSTTVNGTVTTTDGGANIFFYSGGSVSGNVSSGKNITASGGVAFGSDVTAAGDITLSDGGSVAGNLSGKVIQATGVQATGGVVFGGNVTATGGGVTLTGGSVVGQVSSNCCTVTTNGTNVSGGIRSDSNTVTINGGTVTGAIYAGGGTGVFIQGGAAVTSNDIRSPSNKVTIRGGSTVSGVINGNGVDIRDSTITGGSVISGSSPITVSNSTLGSPTSQVDVTNHNAITVNNNSTIYGNVTGGGWPGAVKIQDTSVVYGVCLSDKSSIDDSNHNGHYGGRCENGLPVTIAHYAISFPNGSAGVTCEALKVRITAHDSNHVPVNPPAGTTITVSATNGGSINGDFHSFTGTDSQVDFWLTKTTPGVVNVNVTDGARTEGATEDPNATFADAVFRVYACSDLPSTATCGAVSSLQIAGKPSNHAPDGQNLYLRAVRTDTETGACTSGLQAGDHPIQFGYECNEPATCTDANLMNIAGVTSTDVARNDNGAISATSGTYTDVTLNFDGNGYAPFVLNYRDAGRVTLHARKAQSAVPGPPPRPAMTIHGATTFHVRPFAFLVDVSGNPKASAHDGTKFKAAGESFSATVRGVVWDAADDDDGGVYDGQPRIDADLTKIGETIVEQATTRNFAWETVLKVDPDGGYTPVSGVRGVLLQGASAATLAKAAFQVSGSEGIASVANLNYSEVGSFTLLAETTGYLGQSGFNVSALPVVVGRFIPHHFGVTGTLTNRSDLSSCSSSFTYMDEPMKLELTVTAYNAADVETKNYRGAFAKLDAATLGADIANWTCTSGTQCMGLSASDGSNLTSRLSIDTEGMNSAAPSNTPWNEGSSTFTLFVRFDRDDGPDGRFRLKFGARPLDEDDVTLPPRLSEDLDHCVNLDASNGKEASDCNPGETEANLRRKLFETDVRFGLLKLSTAYGSEQLNLSVPIEARYWNGKAFVPNDDDECTVRELEADTDNVGVTKAAGQPGLTPTVISLGKGRGRIDIPSPDRAKRNAYRICLNISTDGTCSATTQAPFGYLTGPWDGSNFYDRDPSARAVFGLKRGANLYYRERY